MKRKKIALAFVVLIVILVGVVFLLQRDAGDSESSNSTPSQPNSSKVEMRTSEAEATETQAPVAGKYVDYSPGVIAQTAGTKVLFFHAPWCPQCRALEKSIKEGPIPENTTIIKVDYDSNQQLRQEYGITIQTTLVKVDDQGKLVKKYVAYDDPSLEALIRNLL